jgi:hypothetical protein
MSRSESNRPARVHRQLVIYSGPEIGWGRITAPRVFTMRGKEQQTLFFLQKEFVKVGSIPEDGHELIYEVRKAGDIVGELCASAQQR